MSMAISHRGLRREMRKYIRHPSDIPIEINNHQVQNPSTESLVNVSLGGLSFHSHEQQKLGKLISIRISLVEPPFETTGQVVWCKPSEGEYEIGVKLLDINDAFRTRMVEQVCHIEHYKRRILTEEGRTLSGQEAAMEWISKYAQSFPNIHEEEAI